MTAVAHPARSAPREQRIGPVFAALMLVMLIASLDQMHEARSCSTRVVPSAISSA
jgi:hypothetical protein